MKITARIKKNHIAQGKRVCAGKCPIALALLDAGFQKVAVESGYNLSAGKKYTRTAQMIDLSEYISADDQEAISSFVYAFDRDGNDAVSPFKFTLKVPTDLLQKAGFQRPEAV